MQIRKTDKITKAPSFRGFSVCFALPLVERRIKMKPKTKRLTTTGILIAISAVLFAFPVIPLPYDGEVTVAAMVPVIILGYKYGIKWGIFSGIALSLIQIVIGAASSGAFAVPGTGAKMALQIILVVLLDFFAAFTVLGLSGMFKNKISNNTVSLALGAFVVCLLRFIAHFVSGVIVWGSYADAGFAPKLLSGFSGYGLMVAYSFVYNASYMLPETIITVIVCLALISVKPLKKYIVDENA
jgi:thiamine transporter